jgi:retron-type reverse transcriptase
MKRYGNLWSDITDFANLLAAARQAQKGKRFRENVLAFNANLERELEQLQVELTSKTYRPGAYKTFEIKEPKQRMISAAPYRDRVVHHALCNMIVPIFERTFISDSYANRVGYGTHRALRRFTDFARSSRYIFQGDVRKYFPSIDHEILKTLVHRKIKCLDTLWLIDTIIDHSNQQEPVLEYFPGDDLLTPSRRRRGLPIGNLTSQFFANVYLNGFDHFMKEHVKATKYIRYVDDFAVFDDDREFLINARLAAEDYLAGLRLKIHPVKSQIFETKHGANFLGFRIFLDRIRVRTENLRRARRRLRHMQIEFAIGKIGCAEISQSLQSWIAHLEHGNTWRLREQIFDSLLFQRGSKMGQALPGAARGFVEQQSSQLPRRQP